MSVKKSLFFVTFFLVNVVFANPICEGLFSNHVSKGWLEKAIPDSELANLQRIKHATVNNEQDGYLLLKDLPQGADHLGVGGDFNYTVMGRARSTGGTIYDIDANVLAVHHSMRVAFLTAKNPTEFIQFFKELQDQGLNSTSYKKLLELAPKNLIPYLLKIAVNSDLYTYFKEIRSRRSPEGHKYTYLGDSASYQHVRNLYQNDKIKFVSANQFDVDGFRGLQLNKTNSMGTIYLSNTLEYKWMRPVGETESQRNDKKMSAMVMLPDADPIQTMKEILKDLKKYEKLVAVKKLSNDDALQLMGLLNRITYADMQDAGTLNNSSNAWSYFWKNVETLKTDSTTKILSTSRDLVLFGPLAQQNTAVVEEVDFKWSYNSFNYKELKPVLKKTQKLLINRNQQFKILVADALDRFQAMIKENLYMEVPQADGSIEKTVLLTPESAKQIVDVYKMRILEGRQE